MNIDFDDYKEKYAKKEGFKKWCELRQSYLDNPLYGRVPEFVYMRIFEMVVEDMQDEIDYPFRPNIYFFNNKGIKLDKPKSYYPQFGFGDII